MRKPFRRINLTGISFACLLSMASVAGAATVYIDTPDLCSKVQKLEKDRVYLATGKQCPQIRGKVPVEMEAGREVQVFVNGVAWESQRPAEFDVGSPDDSMKRAQVLAGTLDVPKNVHQKEATIAAMQVADYSRSAEFTSKLEVESKKIRKDMLGGIETLENHYPDLKKAAHGPALPKNERVYIFISSSMPLATIRNYAAAIDAIGDPNIFMVMRGMINGMTNIGPTVKFLGNVLKREPTCSDACAIFLGQVQIDPYLFNRYKVTQVPTVVYVKGVEKENDEVSEGQPDLTTAGASYTFLGDVPLSYALDQIAQVSASLSAKTVAKKLGGS